MNTNQTLIPQNKTLSWKSFLSLIGLVLFLATSGLQAQNRVPDCAGPCPCEGNFVEMQVYYFGEDNVTIDVYRNAGLNQLITTFNGVVSGQLLTVDGSGTPTGTLSNHTYFVTTTAGGEACVETIYSKCPTSAWPGSMQDLDVLGKTYGDFTVFSRTDEGNTFVCDISNADQDWHVGGNVVGAANNTMGTRNNENVVFITNDQDRGTITTTGDFGINTLAPGARLDVQGDAIINETLDVNGIARMNDASPSTSSADGALIVTGGAGIGENLNVAVDTRIGRDLATGRDAAIGRNLDVVESVTIGVDASVGNNASIGNNLSVSNDATIGQNLDVTQDAAVGQNLSVGNDADVNNDLTVGSNAFVGQNLSVSDNASVGVDVSIGNDLDVNGDAHVDGVVTIGTNNTPNQLGTVITSGYQLFVDGGILTEEVLVRTGWADYVFEADYELQSLEEVAAHIAQKGHLPNIPSAQEIENNGLSLGNTTVLQQEKIEELFLYLIDMNKAVKDLQAENEALRVELNNLKQ